LFVFVQGFTSSLTPKDIQKNHGYGDPKDFSDIKASLSHEDPTATFLMYSYHGFTDDGKPEPYPCGLTIANDLADAAVGLRSQISQYLLTHSNTDVYVIGHSEGGVVAFSFLTHMAEGKLSLPNKGILKGVFLLDAPIGGVTDNFLYGQFAKAVAARNPGCGRLTDLPAVKDLVRLYTSATLPNFRGATASIDQKIVMLGNKINQTVAIDAMQQGIVVATIGNSNDKMWRPKDVCAVLGGNFPTTQWLYEVRSGRNAQGGAVYSRSFKSGPEIPCSIPTMAKYMLNHADVLKDKNVLLAIWQMVSGGAPKALPARL
jgi:pimeloyl-ACP methyl ester carboxylesterase